jgi:RHS repeat-associated protein
MKKSRRIINRQFIELLCFLLFFVINPILVSARPDNYELRRIWQTKYIDKYFEVGENGNSKIHIYLPNGQKISTVDNDNIYYQITDHLDSPTIVADEQGEILEVNDYGSYGKLKSTNSQIDNNYKFTGKEQDKENNLQYYDARYYDNNIGKFVSVDPVAINSVNEYLADPQKLNSYAYARNNPIRFLDPDGNRNEEFQPYYSDNGFYKYESVFGNYRGIEVVSAGAKSGTVDHPYQCVDLFQRFTDNEYGVKISGLGGAVNYGKQELLKQFNGKYSGDFITYSNGGSIMPQEDDFITWSHSNGVGHIGVITEVVFDDKTGQGYVYSLEQNWSGKQGLYEQKLSRTFNDQGQSVYVVAGRGSYIVQGWTRYQNQSIISGNENYTSIPHTPATKSYINNG